MPKLQNRRIAILATDGYEQSELEKPRDALLSEGAEVHIVSTHSGQIRGWNENDWGDSVNVDKTLDDVSPADYDALVLPGGQINPDMLRNDKSAVRFIKAIFEAKKPIAAICHAPWLLVEAGIAKGRKLTSFHSIRTDLENAGAIWEDSPVVVDQGVVTSRNPDDLPNFCGKMIEEICEGRHEARAA
ncbi:type 1 glutamine amidotransferase domain-containing protein [Roseovarius sp.]|uniref:type 1 glutamine amidotransferase domain-containing protein n=1 Tax=Roseovarius sp. TaxID=1486281 RepID=UPI003D12E318